MAMATPAASTTLSLLLPASPPMRLRARRPPARTRRSSRPSSSARRAPTRLRRAVAAVPPPALRPRPRGHRPAAACPGAPAPRPSGRRWCSCTGASTRRGAGRSTGSPSSPAPGSPATRSASAPRWSGVTCVHPAKCLSNCLNGEEDHCFMALMTVVLDYFTSSHSRNSRISVS